jgi:hypothetical protein
MVARSVDLIIIYTILAIFDPNVKYNFIQNCFCVLGSYFEALGSQKVMYVKGDRCQFFLVNDKNCTKIVNTEVMKTRPSQQNKTKQNKTKQNKTKQNKTKQNKTKQNKTKQNKRQVFL